MVKNVTGYDLCKLLAGSWGTLAAMTDVTIKVLPKPETEATVLVAGLDDAPRCAAMAAAMGSSCDVSGAAHLPDHVASYFDGLPKPEAADRAAAGRRRALGRAPQGRRWTALMRPFGPVVAARRRRIPRALWRSIRDVDAVRRRSARGAPALAHLDGARRRATPSRRAITPAAQMFYDWAGGLIWVAMPFADEPDAGSIRGALAELGGHATLIRAPAAVRAVGRRVRAAGRRACAR